MIAVDFPQAQKTLGPPRGVDNCGGLRVWTDGQIVLSAWRPTEEEKARILAGEPIFLWVFSGQTQPPVALEVGSPFEEAAFQADDASALSELGISSGIDRG